MRIEVISNAARSFIMMPIALAMAFLVFDNVSLNAADDRSLSLPSWNDTAPKKAIIAFVQRVRKTGSPFSFRLLGFKPGGAPAV
ncbi:MAG TPA: hypothetical protein VFV34_24725 [Blastocatellia bacterium]|nr:hypothetical protein [Blastocatellia bacterium]